VGVHHEAVEGQECSLGGINSGFLVSLLITDHKMRRIRLELVDGLQLIESRLGARQAQVCGLLHEAQLGVDVLELFGVAQGVPVKRGRSVTEAG